MDAPQFVVAVVERHVVWFMAVAASLQGFLQSVTLGVQGHFGLATMWGLGAAALVLLSASLETIKNRKG